jgi:hypothetical protein
MRIAYVTSDDVNHDLATEMGAIFGVTVQRVAPGQKVPYGLFVAVLHNLDHVPDYRWEQPLEEICAAEDGSDSTWVSSIE